MAGLLRVRRYVQTHARDTDLDDALAASRGASPVNTTVLPSCGGTASMTLCRRHDEEGQTAQRPCWRMSAASSTWQTHRSG